MVNNIVVWKKIIQLGNVTRVNKNIIMFNIDSVPIVIRFE